MAAKFEIASAKSGQFNWVLKSQGRTLATGESYSRRALAERAVESLRKAVAGATVSDLTLKPKAAPAKRTAKAAKPAKATRAAKPAKATRAATPAKSTRKSARSGGAAPAAKTPAKAATKATAKANAATTKASTAKTGATRRPRRASAG
ncbi:MAG TPA: DUF1508 domain-containing protein [Acidimicrobiia bacterium]|nr:DUF1508 domain-containing protein [Acidimicrobiia bacterium]